jgi:carbonic anhydrase
MTVVEWTGYETHRLRGRSIEHVPPAAFGCIDNQFPLHVWKWARSIPGDLLATAVRLNVEIVVTQLRASSPILSEMVTKGHLRVVGAVYSLQTGQVTWLPENAAVTTK